MTRRLRVTNDVDRLDRWLADELEVSRAHAQRLVTAGLVTVDGRHAGKSDQLSAGAVIEVAPEPAAAPVPPPPAVDIRYEDDDVAVIAKPAGLVVHEGAGTSGPTLVDALAAMGVALADTGDPVRPGIVHRLDRGTSGVLVIAKTEPARAGLVTMFKRHNIERRYWALVDGVPEPAVATVDAPIARDAQRRTRFRVDPAGRPAVTLYDVEEDFGRAARLRVQLKTGRTHQVRVHLSALGHPVCGDGAYGADPVLAQELGLSRPALHAYRLAFAHPVTGVNVEVEDNLPDDLDAAWRALMSTRSP